MRKRRSTQRSGSKTSGKKENTYYARNAPARRRYQKQYNYVRCAIGRRKHGKAKLAAIRDRSWKEAKGEIPVYSNTMCCRNGGQDPDRTTRMRRLEDMMVLYLLDRRASLSDEYRDDDLWVTKYIDEIEEMIDNELEAVQRYKDSTTDVKGSSDWCEEMHTRRRSVAVLHQEIELLRQGLDIPLAAVKANTSIAHGNRVNRINFRREYGF